MQRVSSRIRELGFSAALSLSCCSVDQRRLETVMVDDAAAGTPAVEMPTSEAGAAGVATSDGDGGEPTSDASCHGVTGERRCSVAGGAFERGVEPDRLPATVAAFELDELEVTVARFRKFVRSYSGPPTERAGAAPDIPNSGWRAEWNATLPANSAALVESLHCNHDWETWSDEPGARETYPITCVSYYAAFAFCAWSDGRLPTEAEWEYAASGGAQARRYPWGNQEPSAELALFQMHGIGPAGSHAPGISRFGQLDLAGSVWEWTLDLYADYPSTCDRCAELENGFERVLRGGDFLGGAEQLAASYRFAQAPSLALGNIGVRCAYAVGD